MQTLAQCYELLGLRPGASQEEIKEAYHDLVKVWHPDRFGSDERLQARAQEKLKEINEAYEAILSGHVAPGRAARRYEEPAAPAKKGNSMMSIVSVIVLILAVVLVSLIFFTYGTPDAPMSREKILNELA